MKKRLFAAILAAVMAALLLPAAAMASGDGEGSINQEDFIPVLRIDGLPTTAFTEIPLELSGIVIPSDSTNQSMQFSTADDNPLPAAEIAYGNEFLSIEAGTANLVVTIENGLGAGRDYTQPFVINVKNPPVMGGDKIYANGNALIITKGDNDALSTVYIDLDGDGKLQQGEPSLKGANILNAPKDNADLSKYTIYGGGDTDGVYNTRITMLSGYVGGVMGGGNKSTVTGNTTVSIKGGTINGNVYGGGSFSSVTGNTTVSIEGGTINRNIMGGGITGTVTGNTSVSISGGAMQNVIGGGIEDGTVTGNTTVSISGGAMKDVNGGGVDNNSTVGGATAVSVSGKPVIGGIAANDNHGIQLASITNSKVTISAALTGSGGAIVLIPNAKTENTVVAEATTKAHADATKFALANVPGYGLAEDTEAGTVYIKKSIIIKYDANGGTGAMTDGVAIAGVPFTLPSGTFTPPADKQFKEWAIGSANGTRAQAGSALTFSADTTLYAIWELKPIKYDFSDGANGEWTKGSEDDLGFRVEGDFNDYLNVAVDGTSISENNYDAAPGSTVITLKASYLETLGIGKHLLRVNFTNGYAETTFTVKPASAPPKTGDTAAPFIWLTLCLLGMAGIILLTRKQRSA